MKLFVLFLLVTCKCFGFHFTDFKENGIEYVWDKKELTEQGLQVYLQAFRTLYTELKVENRESHFQETMQHEKEIAQKHPEEIHWLVAMKEGKAVGVSIIELFTYPDLYVREMAVLPEYQRQGIGKVMTFAPVRDLPEVRKISIVTRKINIPAVSFYKALGFTTTEFSHSGYDPGRYVGMEWINGK